MPDDFYYGGVTFPLTSSTANSLLRDADPAVYYALEFFAQVIATHVGPRLLAEATLAGATDITAAVAESMPIDPAQFLTEEHFKFPLLALNRESTTFKYLTKRRQAIHKLKLSYVLPPLKPSQAERLLPTLHAVGLLIDQKATDGTDATYTPTAPTGTAGEFVWSETRAAVARVEIKDATIGAYQISNDLFFPAIVMSLEMWELADADTTAYDDYEGADVDTNVRQDSDGTILEDVADHNTYQAPTVTSVSPTSGTTAGGTLVTVTGTLFRTGTRPVVLFDGAAADAVTVVNATTITCLAPPHAAYPSFVADVMVIAADGQTATLEDAFTFNQP